jgi:opacity protein-like surface antigen
MKSTTQIITGIGAALLVGCATSHATDINENLYLHADLGPSFIPDTTAIFHGVSNSQFFGGRGKFGADPGIRGDLSLGYNLTKHLALELEIGATWNPGFGSDSFYQIPIMLNAVYQIPLNNSWKAYFGAGAGEVASINQMEFGSSSFPRPILNDSTDLAFGYQAEAGIKYTVSRRMELDLGYKFLAVNQYNFRFTTPDFAILDMQVNDLFTHSAQLSLTWRF